MIILYNIIFYLLAIPLLPVAALVVLFSPGLRESLDERAGFMDAGTAAKLNGKRTVWFHAASVGEVQALTPIIREFKLMRPELRIMVTTTSVNGKKKIAKELAGDIDHYCLLPADIGFVIKGFVKKINPCAV
ncbi:MAG: hypothetical protein LLG37_11330, partial [Spirochaetia bacterium]|nr:hypothetical protein [Spirochaetia bacterium]